MRRPIFIIKLLTIVQKIVTVIWYNGNVLVLFVVSEGFAMIDIAEIRSFALYVKILQSKERIACMEKQDCVT